AGVIVIGGADIELERTERRPRAHGHRQLDGRAGRKPYAVEIRINVEPALLGVDVGADRRLVRRIAEPATGKTAAAVSRRSRIEWAYTGFGASPHRCREASGKP